MTCIAAAGASHAVHCNLRLAGPAASGRALAAGPVGSHHRRDVAVCCRGLLFATLDLRQPGDVDVTVGSALPGMALGRALQLLRAMLTLLLLDTSQLHMTDSSRAQPGVIGCKSTMDAGFLVMTLA